MPKGQFKNIECRDCNICGKSYLPANQLSLFCNVECKRLGRNKRLRDQSQEEKSDCKRLDRNKRRRDQLLARKPDRQCVACSSEIPKARTSIAIFCSRRCKEKHHGLRAKEDGRHTKKKLKALNLEARQSQGKCANCDETDVRVFEFAHFNREDKEVSVTTHQNLSKVREEFKKGRFLCVWCHRLETKAENEQIHSQTPSAISQRNARNYINLIKLEIGACCFCNIKVTDETFSCFEFDHIDPATKTDTVSSLALGSKEILHEELEKCRLLCCKCHRLRTIEQAKDKYK